MIPFDSEASDSLFLNAVSQCQIVINPIQITSSWVSDALMRSVTATRQQFAEIKVKILLH